MNPTGLCLELGSGRLSAAKDRRLADNAANTYDPAVLAQHARGECHRGLVFLASCKLMQAAFVRLQYIGAHDLFYPALDVLIVTGLIRDLLVMVGSTKFISILSRQSLFCRTGPRTWSA